MGLTTPPPGYNSVVGDVPSAVNKEEAGMCMDSDDIDGCVTLTNPLNYDELVVYDEAALLPAYLIIFPPITK